jgi:hypothetical protein
MGNRTGAVAMAGEDATRRQLLCGNLQRRTRFCRGARKSPDERRVK